jgi:hypothetical protein
MAGAMFYIHPTIHHQSVFIVKISIMITLAKFVLTILLTLIVILM